MRGREDRLLCCNCLFDSCLFTYIRCDHLSDLELLPSVEHHSKRYRVVFYVLFALCIFRAPFSLKSVLDAMEAVNGEYTLLPENAPISEETKRLYAVLRTFLAAISVVIPFTGKERAPT